MKKEPPALHCMRNLELGTQMQEIATVTDYGRASSHLTVIIILFSQEESWFEVVTAVKPIMGKTVWAKIIA